MLRLAFQFRIVSSAASLGNNVFNVPCDSVAQNKRSTLSAATQMTITAITTQRTEAPPTILLTILCVYTHPHTPTRRHSRYLQPLQLDLYYVDTRSTTIMLGDFRATTETSSLSSSSSLSLHAPNDSTSQTHPRNWVVVQKENCQDHLVSLHRTPRRNCFRQCRMSCRRFSVQMGRR